MRFWFVSFIISTVLFLISQVILADYQIRWNWGKPWLCKPVGRSTAGLWTPELVDALMGGYLQSCWGLCLLTGGVWGSSGRLMAKLHCGPQMLPWHDKGHSGFPRELRFSNAHNCLELGSGAKSSHLCHTLWPPLAWQLSLAKEFSEQSWQLGAVWGQHCGQPSRVSFWKWDFTASQSAHYIL